MARISKTPALHVALILAVLLAAAAPPLAAQEKPADEWQFQVDPYLWATGFATALKMPNDTVTTRATFGDAVENIQSAFMFHFGAQKGRWGIVVDPIYASLGKAGYTPAGEHVDADMELYVMGVGGSYRFYQGEKVNLDVIFGGRYYHSAFDLHFYTPEAKRHAALNWWDPYVGCTLGTTLNDRLDFGFRADIAGHGGAPLGYCLAARFDMKMTKVTSLSFGYIHLQANESTGGNESGLDEFKLTLSGPYVGFIFRF